MVDPPPLFSYYHQHQFLTYFSIQVKCIVSFFFNEYRIDSEVRRDWIVRSSIRDRIYLLYSTKKKKGNSLDKLRNHFRIRKKIFRNDKLRPDSTRIEKVATMKMHDAKVFFFPLAVLFVGRGFVPMFKRNWAEHKRFFAETRGGGRGRRKVERVQEAH